MLVGTIKRKNEGAPTIADMPCPAHNMSLQPRIHTFSDSQAAQSPSSLKADTLAGHCLVVSGRGGCRHPARRPGQPVACLQPALQHQTHLSQLKHLLQIGLEGKFWPALFCYISCLKPSVDLYVFFLFWPTPGPP